jgi:hypothetical protein
MQPRIMYIEPKDGIACAVEGEARIGRVTFSKTGKSLYYRELELQSLGGRGCKANYVELETGTRY